MRLINGLPFLYYSVRAANEAVTVSPDELALAAYADDNGMEPAFTQAQIDAQKEGGNRSEEMKLQFDPDALAALASITPPAVQVQDRAGSGEQVDSKGVKVSAKPKTGSDYALTYGVNCGLSTSDGFARVANGQIMSSMNDYAWNTYIVVVDNNNDYHGCGGVIISPNKVLTAANCLAGHDIQYIRTFFGTNTIKTSYINSEVNNNSFNTARSKGVSEYIIHEDYGNSDANSDIAILTLDEDMDFTSNAPYPACLPRSDMCMQANDNVVLNVAGWGAQSDGGNRVKRIIAANMALRKWGDCNWWFANNEGSDHFADWLDETEMCAGGKLIEGETTIADTCNGDEGTPLMLKGADNVNTVVGLSSWGFGCANGPYPRVFTRVSKFLSWIEANAGVYMTGDDLLQGNQDYACHDSGRNEGASGHYDDGNYGFVDMSNLLATEDTNVENLPHDKNKHIWSWNEPAGCLAKARRRDSNDRKIGKFLKFIQRCDLVRDNSTSNKYWNSNFEFEYNPVTKEIVQKMASNHFSEETEYCVMLSHKAVNVAACDTTYAPRPRPFSTWDWLPKTGAFLSSEIWGIKPWLADWRVLYYPTYMTYDGSKRWNNDLGVYEPGYRQGEMHVKHGPFKFNAFERFENPNQISNSTNDYQLQMLDEHSAKLFGDTQAYCVKSETSTLEQHSRMKMQPCVEGADAKLNLGSWTMTPMGNIQFYHDSLPNGANGDNVDYCLESAGEGNFVFARECEETNPNQQWFFADTLTPAQRDLRSGLTEYTLYWGGNTLETATRQCMFVNQSTKLMQVKTCTDMQYSFGLKTTMEYYDDASTRDGWMNFVN